MNRPDDIPPEVWKTAEDAFDLMLCNCIEASGTTEQLRIDSITPLARAILAERERAAQAAEGVGKSYGEDETGWLDCSETIAAAIRRGAVDD